MIFFNNNVFLHCWCQQNIKYEKVGFQTSDSKFLPSNPPYHFSCLLPTFTRELQFARSCVDENDKVQQLKQYQIPRNAVPICVDTDRMKTKKKLNQVICQMSYKIEHEHPPFIGVSSCSLSVTNNQIQIRTVRTYQLKKVQYINMRSGEIS